MSEEESRLRMRSASIKRDIHTAVTFDFPDFLMCRWALQEIDSLRADNEKLKRQAAALNNPGSSREREHN